MTSTKIALDDDLQPGQRVTITIANQGGDTIAVENARVTEVAFKGRDGHTERRHKIQIAP